MEWDEACDRFAELVGPPGGLQDETVLSEDFHAVLMVLLDRLAYKHGVGEDELSPIGFYMRAMYSLGLREGRLSAILSGVDL